jgi:hypothetical protein
VERILPAVSLRTNRVLPFKGPLWLFKGFDARLRRGAVGRRGGEMVEGKTGRIFSIMQEVPMPPFDEMMFRAQQGAIVDAVARQFDLSRDQTIAAIEALMPAFREGLKRNASIPEAQRPFLEALASGRHARYLDDLARAFGSAGTEEGNAILGHIFGSREVSRAIAGHAARMAEVNADTLKRMLPALATLLMGGLSRQAEAGAAEAGAAAGGNPLADLMAQMMRMGQAAPGSGTERRARTSARNPFEKLSEQFLKGIIAASPGQGTAREGKAQRDPGPDSGEKNPFERFGRDYAKEIEAIFEQFMPRGK